MNGTISPKEEVHTSDPVIDEVSAQVAISIPAQKQKRRTRRFAFCCNASHGLRTWLKFSFGREPQRLQSLPGRRLTRSSALEDSRSLAASLRWKFRNRRLTPTIRRT